MASDSIRIQYNQQLQPLEKLLSGVKRAGDFWVGGAMEIPMPKMEIAGAGVLSFPVPPVQVAALIRAATRALRPPRGDHRRRVGPQGVAVAAGQGSHRRQIVGGEL
jgi:hypothetical protein